MASDNYTSHGGEIYLSLTKWDLSTRMCNTIVLDMPETSFIDRLLGEEIIVIGEWINSDLLSVDGKIFASREGEKWARFRMLKTKAWFRGGTS